MKRRILLTMILLLLLALLLVSCRKNRSQEDIGLDGGIDVPISHNGDKEQEDKDIDKTITGDDSEKEQELVDPTPGWESTRPGVWNVFFSFRDSAGYATQVILEVKDGQEAIPPEIPASEGYIFLSWDRDLSAISSNLIVKAIYEKRAQDDPARLHYSNPAANGTCSITGIGSYQGESLVIPAVSPITGAKVIAIEERAFENAKLPQKITIPETILYIRANAFSGATGIRELTLEAFPEAIANSAFNGCNSLHSLVFGDKIETIGAQNTKWLSRISGRLLSVTLGSSVKTIGDGIFDNCVRLVNLKNRSQLSISLGSENLGGIGLHLLENVFDENERIFEQDGFFFYFNENTGLCYLMCADDDAIVNGFMKLPSGFGATKLAYSVYNGAFQDNTSIVNLEIPKQVKMIDSYAFSGCTGIAHIRFEKLSEMEEQAFYGIMNVSLTIGQKEYTHRLFQPNPQDNGYYWYLNNGMITLWSKDDDYEGDIDTETGFGPLVPLNPN